MVGLLFSFSALAKTSSKVAQHNVSVAVFDSRAEDSHAQKILRLFSEKGSECSVQVFPIYDDKGSLDLVRFQKSLEKLPAKFRIIHLSWNQLFEPRFQGVVQLLRGHMAKGVVVVAAGGESQELERMNAPISATVLGQVNGAVIVGELDKKGKLFSRAYYGPELVAAFPPPKGYEGSSFTSVLMTSEICKRGVSEGLSQKLSSVRAESAKQWPELSEYFK